MQSVVKVDGKQHPALGIIKNLLFCKTWRYSGWTEYEIHQEGGKNQISYSA